MKLIKQIPEFNESLGEELQNSGWSTLKEPGNLVSAIILSIPLMAINLLIAIVVIGIVSTISFEEFGLANGSLSMSINLDIIFALLILIVTHELLHLVFIPNFIRSTKTFVGITFYGGFVATEEEIVKSRYLLITIAPFLVGSILLPFILGVLGLLTSTFKLLILLNAMASSVDILSFLLIVKQVPAKAIVKNNGPKTYWKDFRK